jgi:Na+/melibiose symporter-like transporter
LVGLDGVNSFDQETWQIRFDLATFFLPLYCGLVLLAIAVLSRYRIDKENHEANLATLARRRQDRDALKG